MILLKRGILLLFSFLSSFVIFSGIPDINREEIMICLPYTIEGTSIILESLEKNVHTGFTEAIFLNDSAEVLESFYVELNTSSGMYYFESTMLPAGERICLQERDGKKWDDPSLLYGCGYFSFASERSAIDHFRINESELLVHNDDNSVKSFAIYLKPWDNEKQMFLSGKTQKIVIKDFLNNDTLSVKLPDSNYKVVYCNYFDP